MLNSILDGISTELTLDECYKSNHKYATLGLNTDDVPISTRMIDGHSVRWDKTGYAIYWTGEYSDDGYRLYDVHFDDYETLQLAGNTQVVFVV